MAEYIEREKLLEKLHEVCGCDAAPDTWADGYDKAIDLAYGIVQMTPAADVSEIVQCKDCKWWSKQEDSAQGRCALSGHYPTGGWYCANGARMDGEGE